MRKQKLDPHIKFFVEINDKEDIYCLCEESKYEELFSKILANHPEKEDYCVRILWEDQDSHLIMKREEKRIKDRITEIYYELPKLIKIMTKFGILQ